HTELFKDPPNLSTYRFSNLAKVVIDGTTFPGASRDFRPDYAAANMLERINYPTGGYQKFLYEGNDFGGGLRIESIHEVDPVSNNNIIKSFDYFDPQAHSQPVFYYQHQFFSENGP